MDIPDCNKIRIKLLRTMRKAPSFFAPQIPWAKTKQDKAVVSQSAANAVKHRPAEPFGMVLFVGVWCCIGVGMPVKPMN